MVMVLPDSRTSYGAGDWQPSVQVIGRIQGFIFLKPRRVDVGTPPNVGKDML